MSDPRYRGCSIFAETKRVADFHGVEYEIVAGDEEVPADVPGGLAGFTDGMVSVSITATAVVPVRGMVYNFEDQLFAHNYIDIGIGIVNANVHQTRARVVRAKFTSDAKAGRLDGEFALKAFAPNITPSGLN